MINKIYLLNNIDNPDDDDFVRDDRNEWQYRDGGGTGTGGGSSDNGGSGGSDSSSETTK